VEQPTGTLTLFKHDTTAGADPGNTVRSVNSDSEGLLWIRTNKNIYSFNKKTLSFTLFEVDSLSWYPENQAYVLNQNCFLEDKFKNLWFVTNRGLYRFIRETGIFSEVLPGSRQSAENSVKKVNCIVSDPDGTIWIGTEGAGLMRWNPSTGSADMLNGLTGIRGKMSFNMVTSVLADSKGALWSFGTNCFSRFNPKDNTIINYKFLYEHQTVYENPGSTVTVDQSFRFSDGSIWFFSWEEGLVYMFDPSSEKLVLYRTPTFVAFQCYPGRDESIWFACVRYNVFRLVRKQVPWFTIASVNNTADVSQVHKGSIIEDKLNRTWFLFNQGIYVVDDFDISSSLKFNHVKLPGGVSVTSGGFADSRGNLWFGSKDGRIFRYDPASSLLKEFTLPFPSDDIRFANIPLIREDKSGNIWVVTFKHGLYRLDRTLNKLVVVEGLQQHYLNSEQNNINDFLIDSRDNLWILSYENVLRISLHDMKGTDFSNMGDESFREFDSNIRVREDADGDIWILNGISGLNILDRRSGLFRNFNPSGESTASSYYDLLIDRKGKFWIANDKGITVWNPSKGNVRTLKTPKLQYDAQGYQIRSGKIIYINENQLYVFDEDPPVNTVVPPVLLTRFQVNGKDYELPAGTDDISSLKKIVLPFRDNFLRIEFAALNFVRPEENRYRFFMKGIDRDTIDAGQGKAAEYRGVHPGRYSFWLTGSNNDGIWNPEGLSLDIRILPPWYRSAVAYISYLIILFVLLAFFVRIRTRAITREKIRLEAIVKARTAELEQKNTQLAEIDRIKTNFFTDISHEIRTPLTLITGPLETIAKEGMLTGRLSAMLEMGIRNAHRLMHLVNQLLDISKLDTGNMKITLIRDDIVKCLRILVYEFLSMAESKRIKYIAELPEKSYVTLFDRDKTEKIVSNLLSNAFKYTPSEGTVKCIVSIVPSDNDEPGKLLIRVIDSGPGISIEHREKIFDRFYRIEGHHESTGYGTGIGLSLVREFVALLHGSIEVNSVQGHGSEFSVTIPLGSVHLNTEEYIIASVSLSHGERSSLNPNFIKHEQEFSGKSYKERSVILVIEDNKDLRTFIKESFEKDYVFLESENGITGLNTAFTMMPDLIVTDIMMPDLDGVELCRRLKNDERTSHIPVIMLTAKASPEDKIRGLRQGADDYMVKPFNITELETRISNLLQSREKLRSRYSKLNLTGGADHKIESVDDRFIARILKVINANLSNYDFDVESLHEHIGMSKTHLSRKLKILTGLSPGTLIRNTRLEKAAGLLRSKAGNITEVANSVGISNPSNFTKSFRKYFGKSPKDYLK
jgi:signal transduction histidine kinase/DNA-binding response OmpR family regulator/ligand-binding sensor domain-containing protein